MPRAFESKLINRNLKKWQHTVPVKKQLQIRKKLTIHAGEHFGVVGPQRAGQHLCFLFDDAPRIAKDTPDIACNKSTL
jgi:hypothetical protein